MLKKKVYAKILNPELFDYRVYESDIVHGKCSRIIVDGGREYVDIDSNNYLKLIKALINEYCDYYCQVYYNNSVLAYLRDMLPSKENGKALTPKEAHDIKQALENDKDNEIIRLCLSIITGLEYEKGAIRGYCQGDYAEAYYPVGDRKNLEYLEAWYFGTGTEIEIHDSPSEPTCAEEILGFTFYTTSWKDSDIKQDIAQQLGYELSDIEIVLWKYTNTRTIHIDQYERVDL